MQEGLFLTQTLDVPTRNEALPDLLLTSQENLLCNTLASDNPDYSDHKTVEFGIRLVSTKMKILEELT